MALEQLTQTIQGTQQDFDYDLAIAGGGIIGATLACALNNSGLSVVLIEAQPPSVAIARRQAYALSLLSGRIFKGIGVWDKILPQITTYQQIRLSDADHPGIVQFHPSDLGMDDLGFVGEHRPLLQSLYEFLANCPNVSWLCPAEVMNVEYQTSGVDIKVKVDGETRQLRSRLIVAADGARSRIRTAAGIGTHGWKYWQSCVTVRIKPEKSHNNTAFERFWPSGPMGVLPLPDNRCQVVWTAPHAEAQALKELEEKEFLALLEHQSRLALIGDAAHCCHPVGGQGMNLGIRDAAALAQVLHDAHQRSEDIGDIRILRRYERWRKKENLVILGFTDFLDRLFSNRWLPVVAFRRLGLWMLRTVQPLKVLTLRLMTGLLGRHPQLAQH